MEKRAIITIGVPGSGKTTGLKPLAERYGLYRVSRDEIRKEWFGDPLIQTDKKRVWKEAEERMRAALASGQSVVLDSTFTERTKREDIIRTVRGAGAERVIGIVFTVSLELAKERNRKRTVPVPEHVIDEKYHSLNEEPPIIDEGFDVLYMSDELSVFEEKELRN